MPTRVTDPVRFFLDQDLREAAVLPIASGVAAVYTARCPGREPPNEDAAALITCGPESGVLAVADGFGGQPAGEQAARLTLEALARGVEKAVAAGGKLRGGILDGFERANEAVTALGVGAATTLAALEIDNGRVRSYHVGDSMVLIVGQRGKLKLQTVSHSPVGYAEEAGWLEEAEALQHEDRHIVSNMVGSPDMRIEIGSSRKLRPRDTVLLGSDGLFDNLQTEEILEVVRTGRLSDVTVVLSAECDRRMRSPDEGQPSKPDDLTFILYRVRG
jgi:serine/threonine protein phosphatase PrpC